MATGVLTLSVLWSGSAEDAQDAFANALDLPLVSLATGTSTMGSIVTGFTSAAF
jgi:hypothetical protein